MGGGYSEKWQAGRSEWEVKRVLHQIKKKIFLSYFLPISLESSLDLLANPT